MHETIMWDELAKWWHLIMEGLVKSCLPLSLFLLCWSSLDNMGLDHIVPMSGILISSCCQRFTLNPGWLDQSLRPYLPPDWCFLCPQSFVYSDRAVLLFCQNLHQCGFPFLVITSNCLKYNWAHYKFLDSLAPHESHPLEFVLSLAHAQLTLYLLLPVSCQSVVLKSQHTSPLRLSGL